MKSPQITLTPVQLQALRDFASRHGRRWKWQLNVAWTTGLYPSMDDDSGALQQIRNTFGPSWLVRFRFPAAGGQEYVELCGGACDDCTIAIANNDYSGMSDEVEAAVRAGIARIGQHLIVGEDRGFSHSRCAVCGGLAGNRHDVGYLQEAK